MGWISGRCQKSVFNYRAVQIWHSSDGVFIRLSEEIYDVRNIKEQRNDDYCSEIPANTVSTNGASSSVTTGLSQSLHEKYG